MKRILVVDDHRLIYDGLRNHFPENVILDYARDTEEGCRFLKDRTYGSAIIDISLGEESGFSLIPFIPRTTMFFFLSMHKSPYYIQKAKETGARGYFIKDEPIELLIDAMGNPLCCDFWLSPQLQDLLVEPQVESDRGYDRLSAREQQIFALLAKGLGYKEIAFRLRISSKTVNNHRDNIYRKMEISTAVDLVKKALRLEII